MNDIYDVYEINGSIEEETFIIDGSIEEEELFGGKVDNYFYNGLSAYEIAVKNGYVGTEEEWLKSLHGKVDDEQVQQIVHEVKDQIHVPVALSELQDDLGNNPVHTHSQYITEHQSLEDYAKKNELPTKTSELTNDSGYITSSYHDTTKQDKITDLETIRDGASKGATALQEHQSLEDYATKQFVNNQGFIKDYTETDPTVPNHVKSITQAKINEWNNKSTFSGSYNDLADKPTIPKNTSQLTNDSHYVSDNNYVHTDNNYTTNDKTKLSGLENYDDTDIRERINAIEVAKFPNVTIYGTPTIQQGQVSNLSNSNYLKFPFVVNFQNRPFSIKFDITTGSNITNQENIFDSDFGLAFAIRNGRFICAYSTNGTSWHSEHQGTHTITARTSYMVDFSWNGSVYTVSYSTNGGETYVVDMTFNDTSSPYPKQIYIGIGENNGVPMNHFSGIINLNNCSLEISNKVVWMGMDDVGLATRMAIDMSNIDEAGQRYINNMIESKSLSDFTDDLGSNPTHTHSQYMTDFTESDPTVPIHVKNIKSTDIANWNAKSDFSGSYNDLSNKPTIPTDDDINALIDLKLGVIENGSY